LVERKKNISPGRKLPREGEGSVSQEKRGNTGKKKRVSNGKKKNNSALRGQGLWEKYFIYRALREEKRI